MRINEIDNVVRHPALKRKETFDNLLMSDDHDDIIAFIMDDNNTESRRLALLKRLDLMLGDAQESYSVKDLDNFMNDQGPSDWRSKLRKSIEAAGGNKSEYGWTKTRHDKEYPVDWENLGKISDEEMIEIAKDLKIPPYHLSVVDEQTQDDDISTGEYELCNKCFGEGCSECEEGLVDVTGEFKIPDFSDFK